MIHHATIKRAASLGIILTEEEGTAVAHHAERNIQIENEDPKFALLVCQVAAKLKLEYPGILINDEGEAALIDGEDDPFYTIEADADFDETVASLLEAAAEAGMSEEEEEGTGKVIVGEKYKSEYRARGDASGCGDWLFQTLKRYVITHIEPGAKGKDRVVKTFDEPGFTQMLVANGVPMDGKWVSLPDSGQKGWEGRYRMNGRQKLEIPVCRTGNLMLEDGTVVKVPSDDLDQLRQLHPALLEEIETAEEEARIAAEKAPKKKKGAK